MGNSAARDTRRLDAAEKAKRAAELRRSGMTLQQIADEVGYKSKSSARRALLGRMDRLPALEAGELRAELDAKYAHAEDVATKAMKSPDVTVRLRGAETKARIVHLRATLWGVEGATKLDINVAPPPASFDLARLSVPEIAILKYLQALLQAENDSERPRFDDVRGDVEGWLRANPPRLALPPVVVTPLERELNPGERVVQAAVVDEDDL